MQTPLENKSGYKQTEIGFIPMDWDVKSYGDVFRFLKTATYSRAELTENGEVGYIHYGDIHTKWNFHLDVSANTLPSINKEKLKGYSLIENGDVVMADASEDYTGISKSVEIKNIGNRQVISGLHTFLLRDYEGAFIDGYRGYLHSIDVVKKQFDELATGMKVYGVSKTNLKKVLIPIPFKNEQINIANALSDADSYIGSLEKLIAKKRDIKQGAMQELLQPKEGWEEKKLGDVIFNFQNGYTFSAECYVKDGIPIVTMAQIGLDGSFQFDETKINYWRSSDFNLLRNFHLANGDVIIAMTDVTPEKNLIGRMAIVKTDRTLLLNQRVGHLRIDKTKINPVFLATLSNMKKWRLYCISSASLGVQANIGTKDILNGKIDLPSIKEQNEIANILNDIDAEIETLDKKLEKAKQIKQGMMQQLLTGKIRLI